MLHRISSAISLQEQFVNIWSPATESEQRSLTEAFDTFLKLFGYKLKTGPQEPLPPLSSDAVNIEMKIGVLKFFVRFDEKQGHISIDGMVYYRPTA